MIPTERSELSASTREHRALEITAIVAAAATAFAHPAAIGSATDPSVADHCAARFEAPE